MRAQLALGDGEAARSAVKRAIELAQGSAPPSGKRVRTSRGRGSLRALEGAAARDALEACLGHAETLIAETGARAQTPFVIEERARFAMVLGDPSPQEARYAFEAMGAAGHAARLANELAAAHAETTGRALGPLAQDVK